MSDPITQQLEELQRSIDSPSSTPLPPPPRRLQKTQSTDADKVISQKLQERRNQLNARLETRRKDKEPSLPSSEKSAYDSGADDSGDTKVERNSGHPNNASQQHKLMALQSDNQLLKAQITEANFARDAAQKEANEAKRSDEAAQAAKNLIVKQLEQSEASLEETSQKHTALHNEHAELLQTLDSTNEEHFQLRQRYDQLAKDHSEVKQKHEDLGMTYSKSQDNLSMHMAQLDEVNTRHDQVTTVLSTLQQESEDLKRNLKTRMLDYESLKEELALIAEQLELKIKSLDEANAKTADLERANAQLQLAHDSRIDADSHNLVVEDVKSKVEENRLLALQISEQAEQIQQYQSQLISQEEEVRQLQTTVKDQAEELTALQRELDAYKENNITKYESGIPKKIAPDQMNSAPGSKRGLSPDNINGKWQTDASETDTDPMTSPKRVSSFFARPLSLVDTPSVLDMAGLQARISSQANIIDKLQQSLQITKTQNQDLDQEIQILRSNNEPNNGTKSIDFAHAGNSHQDELEATITEQSEKIFDLEERLEKQSLQLEKLRKASQRNSIISHESLHERKSSSQIEHDAEDSTTVIANLRQELEEQSREFEHLESEYTAVRDELESASQEIAELRQELDAGEGERKELLAEHAELIAKNVDLVTRVGDHEASQGDRRKSNNSAVSIGMTATDFQARIEKLEQEKQLQQEQAKSIITQWEEWAKEEVAAAKAERGSGVGDPSSEVVMEVLDLLDDARAKLSGLE